MFFKPKSKEEKPHGPPHTSQVFPVMSRKLCHVRQRSHLKHKASGGRHGFKDGCCYKEATQQLFLSTSLICICGALNTSICVIFEAFMTRYPVHKNMMQTIKSQPQHTVTVIPVITEYTQHDSSSGVFFTTNAHKCQPPSSETQQKIIRFHPQGAMNFYTN